MGAPPEGQTTTLCYTGSGGRCCGRRSRSSPSGFANRYGLFAVIVRGSPAGARAHGALASTGSPTRRRRSAPPERGGSGDETGPFAPACCAAPTARCAPTSRVRNEQPSGRRAGRVLLPHAEDLAHARRPVRPSRPRPSPRTKGLIFPSASRLGPELIHPRARHLEAGLDPTPAGAEEVDRRALVPDQVAGPSCIISISMKKGSHIEYSEPPNCVPTKLRFQAERFISTSSSLRSAATLVITTPARNRGDRSGGA